jgi:hypothetical protein
MRGSCASGYRLSGCENVASDAGNPSGDIRLVRLELKGLWGTAEWGDGKDAIQLMQTAVRVCLCQGPSRRDTLVMARWNEPSALTALYLRGGAAIQRATGAFGIARHRLNSPAGTGRAG